MLKEEFYKLCTSCLPVLDLNKMPFTLSVMFWK